MSFPRFATRDSEGNKVWVLPVLKFSKYIELDVTLLEKNPAIAEWLRGELQSDEGISDNRGTTWWGADVQDVLKLDAAGRFHAHLDKHPHCDKHPFNLCPAGAALLAATSGG